ncbi:histone-lysine N-methyltransferase SETDB1-A [Pholidichthys leucotaenia]
MEGDEIEMTKEELQEWIRDKVKKTKPMTPVLLEKYKQLEALLEKKEKRAAHLLKLCTSVTECEEVVKNLYSMLGWTYTDMDSKESSDHCGSTCSGQNSPSSREPAHSPTEARLSPAFSRHSPVSSESEDSKITKSGRKRSYGHFSLRDPVVVLSRLPSPKVTDSPPTLSPQSQLNEAESLDEAGSEWEGNSEADSSDSDFTVSSSGIRSTKKRRMSWKSVKTNKRRFAPERIKNSKAEASGAMTLATTVSASHADSTATKASTPQANPKASADESSATKMVQVNKNATTLSNPVRPSTTTTPAVSKETPSNKQPKEITLNTKLLARRNAQSWKRGTVAEIVTREAGKIKYKVVFEEKGKCYVSSYHVAFDCPPPVNELSIRDRVVIKLAEDDFQPGILAELPGRKNRMRFLVFLDDHKALYVGLPKLRKVFQPMEEPLDDLPDSDHKTFLERYFQYFPNPPQTQYFVGQNVRVLVEEDMKKTEVITVDCSLIEVLFLNNQHKEWLFRGSHRLEHMINFKGQLPLKTNKPSETAKSTD